MLERVSTPGVRLNYTLADKFWSLFLDSEDLENVIIVIYGTLAMYHLNRMVMKLYS